MNIPEGLTLKITHHHPRGRMLPADFREQRYRCASHALALGQIHQHGRPTASTKAYHARVITIATIEDEAGREISVGYAFCNDNYDRRRGNAIATGRAIKFLDTGGRK